MSDNAMLVDLPQTDELHAYALYTLQCNGQVVKVYPDDNEIAVYGYMSAVDQMLKHRNVSAVRFGGPIHICSVMLVRRDEEDGTVRYVLDSGEVTCGEHTQ